jgi:uncharacterized surface protein with fasciclin (FAS1) repeats
LKAVLTYHVVSGKFDAATVIDAINKNNGKYSVTTVQGGTIVKFERWKSYVDRR